MSETTNQEANAQPVEDAGATENSAAPELGEGGKKAIQAERDARRNAEKTAAELKARLDEIESANLSELEKAQRSAQDAAAELARLRTENVRSRVALAKGVPADLIDFLTGETEEDVAAKADVLMARLGAPASPKPDLSQGAKGGDKKGSTAEQFGAFLNEQLSH